MQKEAQHQIEQYAKQILPTFSKQLQHLINIRSESQDPAQRKNLPKILQAIGKIMQEMDIKYQIIPNHGYPILIATIPAKKSNQTITLYNHLDVQPADAKDWQLQKYAMKHPFDAKEKNGIIRGRGATDDKGPALTALHALNALQKLNLPHPTIQIIYETEEESGSNHFTAFLQENKKLLKKPNAILVTDTIFEGDHPSITCSLRGLAKTEIIVPLKSEHKKSDNPPFEVIDIIGGDQRKEGVATKIPPQATVKVRSDNPSYFVHYAKKNYPRFKITQHENLVTITAKVGTKDIHSGVFGGIVRNPLTTLCHIAGSYATTQLQIPPAQQNSLTQLCTFIAKTVEFKTGKIKIAQFYKDTPQITPKLRSHLQATAKAVNLFHDLQHEGIDLTQLYTKDGVEARIRAWYQPTLELHGFVIDKEKQHVRLKVTSRLVGKQNPHKILQLIEQHTRTIISQAHCTHHMGTPAIMTEVENSYINIAAKTCTKHFGKKTLFVGGGGTIGSMPPFANTFPNTPIVFLALSKMSDGYHAPNECYELAQAAKGMNVIAHYLHEIATKGL
ncbi:M20/M25/M40 family metallo-hydrolase [Candidatus Woesearchaeota archaeon]|nr:M20/M25/M40 family metallo-hydrolase [Candidatus Woesearchaeota archaeon]